MRTLELAGLRVHVAGGHDREGGGHGPLVVLLHGYGAPGTDLVPLWRELRVASEVRFAFPEAPITLDMGYPSEGRAWWNIDVVDLQRRTQRGDYAELTTRVPEGLPEARSAVNDMLDALLPALGVPSWQLILGGFSQGAMLATDIVLTGVRACAGLVILSGSLVAQSVWKAHAARRAGLPVLQSHGRGDPILPFAVAEELRDFLKAEGLLVEWHTFSGGHGIPEDTLERLGPFCEQVTGL